MRLGLDELAEMGWSDKFEVGHAFREKLMTFVSSHFPM